MNEVIETTETTPNFSEGGVDATPVETTTVEHPETGEMVEAVVGQEPEVTVE